jgi:hypothetical protein
MPCVNSPFCALCRRLESQAARQREVQTTQSRIPANWDSMSLDQLWEVLNRPHATPKSTIEAVLLSVRERGLAALKEQANIERLSRCDAAAKAEINRRIARLVASNEIAA